MNKKAEPRLTCCPFCDYDFIITKPYSDITSHLHRDHSLTKRQSVDFSKWLRKLIAEQLRNKKEAR